MSIETNLNVSPYFDDVDNALNNNYHRILFRPAVPVQARELTQLQDILQNQIERFGDNIFVTGSIIKGCNFSFDTNYHYAKILDLRPIDSQPAQPSSYVGKLGYEATSNLYAICYNYQDGFESQTPDLKTLYFKYLNTGTAGQSAFSPGSQITFYNTSEIAQANSTTAFANADIKIASGTDAVGKGYAMTVSSGVLFQKGHFIQVPTNDTVIVSKYSQYPNNVVAGFLINENIVTYNQDQTLLDNATGYSNFSAPGADRLQLSPDLVAYATNAAPSNNFFALVEWQNGNIVRSFQETQYSLIGNEMAKRTFEASGNFVVKPFRVNMQEANVSHNFAVVSAGLAYVEGHRVEQLNNVYVPVRKGTDTKISTGQKLQSTYDNSLLIGEVSGSFPTNRITTISLRDTSANRISNNQFANTAAAGNEIGQAKILAMQYDNGTVGAPDCIWRLYLTDIDMNLGKNFRDVKSVYSNSSINGVYGCADVVRVYDSVSNTYTASLQGTNKSALVFPTSKVGMINLTQSGTLPKYIYRTIANTTIIGSTGNSSSISTPTNAKFPYGKGELTSNELKSIVVIPTAIAGGATYANVTLTKTGNVILTSGSSNVVANATAATTFSTDYQVGDFFVAGAGNVIKRIINIANNTFMTVDSTYSTTNNSATHTKCYPINVPINFQQRNSLITVTDTDEKLMSMQLKAANGTNETLSADLTVSVHHNVLANNSSDRNLQAIRNIHVNINTSNNTAKAFGPWCLGVAYPYKINKVYKSSNTGIFVGNTNGTTTLAASTTGFANGVAVFGPGIVPGTTANVSSPTAFVLSTAATTTATNTSFKFAYYSNNAKDDVTSSFYLQNGQTDALFEHGFLAVKETGPKINLTEGDLLTVVFDAFRPLNANSGYISIDSYSSLVGSGILSYETIPTYTDKNNNEFFLRDSVDFRNFTANSAAYTNTFSGSVTINPVYNVIPANIVDTPPTTNTELYVSAPDQHFQYDAYHYLPRVDKLLINSFGKYQVIEGKALENPVPPETPKGGMPLSIIHIPAFPSYTASLFTTNVSSSYVTSSTINQNRAYTMRDIAKLDNRIRNLEYYTSLNLLEQQTSSLTIVSDVTGANRFKNGIFVDNFNTTDLLDLDNPEFKASLSTSESALVPRYTFDRIGLNFSNGTNVVANGGIVRLANAATSEVSLVNQTFATETFQCATSPYAYCGTIIVSPKYDPVPKVCNRKWNTGQSQRTRTINIPFAQFTLATSGVASFQGGFDIREVVAGNPVRWSLSAVGYDSFIVNVTGPGGYTFNETLFFSLKDGIKCYSAELIVPYTYPGFYTISLTKVLTGGFTESTSTNFVYTCEVTPLICPSLPDTGKGVGRTFGKLATVIVSKNTIQTGLPIAENPGALVGNTATSGGIIYTPQSFAAGIQQSRDLRFNSDLIRAVAFTPDLTSSTTSSFKTPVLHIAATNIKIPGIVDFSTNLPISISLDPEPPFGSEIMNYN